MEEVIPSDIPTAAPSKTDVSLQQQQQPRHPRLQPKGSTKSTYERLDRLMKTDENCCRCCLPVEMEPLHREPALKGIKKTRLLKLSRSGTVTLQKIAGMDRVERNQFREAIHAADANNVGNTRSTTALFS